MTELEQVLEEYRKVMEINSKAENSIRLARKLLSLCAYCPIQRFSLYNIPLLGKLFNLCPVIKLVLLNIKNSFRELAKLKKDAE